MKIKLDDLRILAKSSESRKVKGTLSEIGLREFMLSVGNLVNHVPYNLQEDELAMLTISLDNWITTRNKKTISENITLGDIFFTDLGMNYKPECSYPHPVVILDIVDDLVFVVPTSTADEKINIAYHPIDKINGNPLYRKVNKDEDNFEDTCVLLLANVRTISKGRLIRRKDCLKQDINDPKSLFVEIKNTIFEKYFPMQYKEFLKLKRDNELLKLDNKNLHDKMNSEIDRLVKIIDAKENLKKA